jgi:hypothetical protein
VHALGDLQSADMWLGDDFHHNGSFVHGRSG